MKLEKLLKYAIKKGKKDKIEKSTRRLIKKASLQNVENI
jgi:hypothetical protein